MISAFDGARNGISEFTERVILVVEYPPPLAVRALSIALVILDIVQVVVAAVSPVSYTHLDVYKRQRLAMRVPHSGNFARRIKIRKNGCLLYTSRSA